jgi:outer membrane protein assembly factor BamB
LSAARIEIYSSFVHGGRFTVIALVAATLLAGAAEARGGWFTWRGPHQSGVSDETGLPDKLAQNLALWSVPLAGRGSPVLAGDRLYAIGYAGTGADMREKVVCLEAATGKTIWEHGFSDFLSDIIYERYAIGAPVVDAETGNVYALTSPGLLVAFDADGKPLWERSLMEELGRLTFPNGRTGGPVIDGDLLIFHSITANWGEQGPARDRFYAYDKRTGEPVWASAPGETPSDNSFSMPVFAWRNGRRVFYAGTGCGHVVCVDARTGERIWRHLIAAGGVNCSMVLAGDDTVIAIQGVENVDSSETGRMVAVKDGKEIWRNPLAHFSSSPVIVGDRVYQMTQTGELASVDAKDGRVLWKHKLAPYQLHASPLYADGKLYVGHENGVMHVVKPADSGPTVVSGETLDGGIIGSAVVWRGRVYVFTTKMLYCWGKKEPGPEPTSPPEKKGPEAGTAVKLQIVPSEVLLAPGASAPVRVRALDANGATAAADLGKLAWEKFVPPTAKVKAFLDASFPAADRMQADAAVKPSAGAFKATAGALSGTMRGRVLPVAPLAQDFEAFKLEVAHEKEAGVKFAFPPLPWIGARFKWEVRQLDGSNVLAKTLDTPLFQRAMAFIGPPDVAGCTLEADVMSDGNRRVMSTVGLINQRYLIALEGNWQRLEVSSNQERLKESVPFAWKPNVWYRLKTRVDVAGDGNGVVRAKAWPRGTPEPAAWTIEVKVPHAHAHGAPGFYGFSPQSQKRVYIDNISLTRSP